MRQLRPGGHNGCVTCVLSPVRLRMVDTMHSAALLPILLLPRVSPSPAPPLTPGTEAGLAAVLERRLDTVFSSHTDQVLSSSRTPRQAGRFPAIKKKQKKVRTCQNMAGILGGSNAFNFINFVAAVVTLVVNVNNNINNNNNNLNNVNVNTNNANNANANVNNNGVNSVVVMPGR